MSSSRLKEILETMKVPPARINDLGWLSRNLGIWNNNHPDYNEALRIIRMLIKVDKNVSQTKG